MVVLDAELPRRVETARLRDLLLLLRRVALDLRLELRLLDPRRGERRVELLADVGRPAGDAADVADVAVVFVVLAARGAAAREHDEQHDGQDQERDQAGEPQHRDQARGRPDRTPRAARRLPPGRSYAFGRLFGL